MRDGVNERVKVERREVGVLRLDEDDGGVVVPGEVDEERQAVVEVGERDAVLRADGLPDYDFVDVVELVPVLITGGEGGEEGREGEGGERGREGGREGGEGGRVNTSEEGCTGTC